jgi:hypothetical protein
MHRDLFFGLLVLTVVPVMSTISWDVKLYSPVDVHRCSNFSYWTT